MAPWSKLLEAHLDMLACPVCYGRLRMAQENGAQAIDCTVCSRRYPIVDGLPVLMPSRGRLPS